MQPRVLYLAARYERRPLIKRRAREIERLGHVVTSSWLDGRAGLDTYDEALRDLRDIERAEELVLFTEPGAPSTGGRHFETGYAHRSGLRFIRVGAPENVFHELADETYKTWRDFLKSLV